MNLAITCHNQDAKHSRLRLLQSGVFRVGGLMLLNARLFERWQVTLRTAGTSTVSKGLFAPNPNQLGVTLSWMPRNIAKQQVKGQSSNNGGPVGRRDLQLHALPWIAWLGNCFALVRINSEPMGNWAQSTCRFCVSDHPWSLIALNEIRPSLRVLWNALAASQTSFSFHFDIPAQSCKMNWIKLSQQRLYKHNGFGLK